MFMLAYESLTSHRRIRSSIEARGPSLGNGNDSHRWVVHKGVKYRIGDYVCYSYDLDPCFARITSLSIHGSNLNVSLKRCETLHYSEHLIAYAVRNLENEILTPVNALSKPLNNIVKNSVRFVSSEQLA